MTRPIPTIVNHLCAEYARQHPSRPPKEDFNDELLVAVAFLLRQIDPSGKAAIHGPPMHALGLEPHRSVKSKRNG